MLHSGVSFTDEMVVNHLLIAGIPIKNSQIKFRVSVSFADDR